MDFTLTIRVENNSRKAALLTIDGITYAGKYTYEYACVKCDFENKCTEKINNLCCSIDKVRISHEDTLSVYWIKQKKQ